MRLHCFYTDEVKAGKRFVAFYGDGSGANLFRKDKDGNYYDTDGEFLSQDWFIDSGYIDFAYLPDDFKFWSEVKNK